MMKHHETTDALDRFRLASQSTHNLPVAMEQALGLGRRALIEALDRPNASYPTQASDWGWFRTIMYTRDERNNVLNAEAIAEMARIEERIGGLLREQCLLQYTSIVDDSPHCRPAASITTRLFLTGDAHLACPMDTPGGATAADACVRRRLISARLLTNFSESFTTHAGAFATLTAWARAPAHAAVIHNLAVRQSNRTKRPPLSILHRAC